MPDNGIFGRLAIAFYKTTVMRKHATAVGTMPGIRESPNRWVPGS